MPYSIQNTPLYWLYDPAEHFVQAEDPADKVKFLGITSESSTAQQSLIHQAKYHRCVF